MEQDLQTTLQAQAAHEPELLAKQNVVGVAVGMKSADSDELAVVVLVTEKMPLSALSAQDVVPRNINGVRTDVVAVGELRALQTSRDRWRPQIPAGVSIAHHKVTAGTLGAIVTDRTTGERLILSNNHVLANNNDAQIGDAILQPGTADGGTNPGDLVARLAMFVPLRFVGEPEPTPPDPTPTPPTPPPAPPPGTGEPNGCVTALVALTNLVATLTGSRQKAIISASASSAPVMPAPVAPSPARAQAQSVDNLMDAALARPVNPDMFTGSILNIGTITGTKAPQLGMLVRKSGRTTGLTQGRITLLNATVNVAFGTKTARFTGQVITEAMSQGGDSGSLVVDTQENLAVGLLFAGSPLATIFTPIDIVLGALNVRF